MPARINRTTGKGRCKTTAFPSFEKLVNQTVMYRRTRSHLFRFPMKISSSLPLCPTLREREARMRLCDLFSLLKENLSTPRSSLNLDMMLGGTKCNLTSTRLECWVTLSLHPTYNYYFRFQFLNKQFWRDMKKIS